MSSKAKLPSRAGLHRQLRHLLKTMQDKWPATQNYFSAEFRINSYQDQRFSIYIGLYPSSGDAYFSESKNGTLEECLAYINSVKEK